jgi:hypothetical protein
MKQMSVRFNTNVIDETMSYIDVGKRRKTLMEAWAEACGYTIKEYHEHIERSDNVVLSSDELKE